MYKNTGMEFCLSGIVIRHILLITVVACISCDSSSSPVDENDTSDIAPKQGDYHVDIHDAAKAFQGTTIFADTHDEQKIKIVEVDMDGTVIWEYTLPSDIVASKTVGLDVEVLESGNILLTLSGSGVFEINRGGTVVWEHRDTKISHDADRLGNGNTIYVYGNDDTKDDPCVKEIDPSGNMVWSWYARDVFDPKLYADIFRNGWTHANSVTRMENGNTLVSLRNFNRTVEIDTDGALVWEIDWENLYQTGFEWKSDPHDPELQTGNTMLCCLQWETPYQAVEIDRTSKLPVWEYHRNNFRTCRDADRLPNDNVLLVGVMEDTNESVIFEVTRDHEIVWQLKLYKVPVNQAPGHFFKAQRLSAIQ
ncbi:aryl-sulfate sulfotransferase [Candidatus Latescibacterota bacterium]